MITINDSAGTLDPQQVQLLQAKAAAYPFPIHVLIDSTFTSKAQFEQQVARLVDAPNALAVGVDPIHHFTYVRGGSALGLPNGPEVAQAGNAWFRKGDLVQGIDSIATRANELRVDARLVQSQTGVPIVMHNHTTSSGVWWLLGGLAALVVVTLMYLRWRAKRREQALVDAQQRLELETVELAQRNVEEQSWHDRMQAGIDTGTKPVTAQPAPTAVADNTPKPFADWAIQNRRVRGNFQALPPQPVQVVQPAPVVVQDNSATNLLIGMELGRMGSSPRVVEREVVVERTRESSSSSSSWGSSSDSSSSSSWDSGSSSSSSSDWGGGSDSGSSGGGSDW